MRNGKTYEGVILARTDEDVDFVHIARQRGKRMHLVSISFDAQSIESIELLTPPQREALRAQIQPLLVSKSLSVIEAGRMEDVTLSEEERGGRRYYVYQHPWFNLQCSADEESTRRCAVRIEQILRAFRLVLPPRTAGRGSMRVLLFGSMDEYRQHVNTLGLRIDNPAYYSAAENLIVAGSDLVLYRQRLQAIQEANDRLKQRIQEADRRRNELLGAVAKRLRNEGVSELQVEEELRIRKAAWEREKDSLLGQTGEGGVLGEINRANQQVFQDVTSQMFRRLYHEAFHAYLDNYVFPATRHDVPRWLNEGLAQVFENGQLDADTLRIDAPDEKILTTLRRDLNGPQPLSLSQVLTADPQVFLAKHGDTQASDRYYAYSWGIAWHLTFERDLLGGPELAEYVSPEKEYVSPEKTPPGPIERFEKLVGMPLAGFEAEWRKAMSATGAPPR